MAEVRQVITRPIAQEQLRRIVRADEIGRRYENIFPTSQSWKWFRRTRKAAMLQAGALIQTTAGDMIDPVLFEAMLPELLMRQTQALPPTSSRHRETS
ncbi:hypothetical protein [Azohydromonas sediminis]|uniref:hypothetical protein n=1 Tax=Azohydromonas sediminis TaxID=2259674 RepID=UPI000E656D72|nr:hypothetical protein [Azohydromonas sediminis]